MLRQSIQKRSRRGITSFTGLRDFNAKPVTNWRESRHRTKLDWQTPETRGSRKLPKGTFQKIQRHQRVFPSNVVHRVPWVTETCVQVKVSHSPSMVCSFPKQLPAVPPQHFEDTFKYRRLLALWDTQKCVFPSVAASNVLLNVPAVAHQRCLLCSSSVPRPAV